MTLITANTMRFQLARFFDLVNRALARFVALPLLWLYRHIGSPIATMLGSRCRFYPSCSHYAQEAFHLHGFFRGFLLSTIRLAKCNPLHPGGHDPVPPAKDAIHHGLHEQCSHH